MTKLRWHSQNSAKNNVRSEIEYGFNMIYMWIHNNKQMLMVFCFLGPLGPLAVALIH